MAGTYYYKSIRKGCTCSKRETGMRHMREQKSNSGKRTMKKKIVSLLLMVTMVLALTACGNKQEEQSVYENDYEDMEEPVEEVKAEDEREEEVSEKIAKIIEEERPDEEVEISLDSLEYTGFTINSILKDMDGNVTESVYTGMEIILPAPCAATYNPVYSGGYYNHYTGDKIEGVCVTVGTVFNAALENDKKSATVSNTILYDENGYFVFCREGRGLNDIYIYMPDSDTEKISINCDFKYGSDSDYSNEFIEKYWELVKEAVVANCNGEIHNMVNGAPITRLDNKELREKVEAELQKLEKEEEADIANGNREISNDAEKAKQNMDISKADSTLSIDAQHQISAFIGTLYNYSFDTYSRCFAETENLMWLIHYYMNDCGGDSSFANENDMPFNWKNGEITKEEFDIFFENGWGVKIPEDFTYMAGEEYDPAMGYGIRITENGWESIVDGSLMMVQGGTVSVVENENGLYKLEGTFLTTTVDAPDDIEEKTFTASARYSGDGRIYDGLTIIDFAIK